MTYNVHWVTCHFHKTITCVSKITNSEAIYTAALELFKSKWNGFTPIRLIGLGVSGVVSEDYPDQLELFPEPEDKKKKVEETIAKLKKKMKNIKLTKASLLDKD